AGECPQPNVQLASTVVSAHEHGITIGAEPGAHTLRLHVGGFAAWHPPEPDLPVQTSAQECPTIGAECHRVDNHVDPRRVMEGRSDACAGGHLPEPDPRFPIPRQKSLAVRATGHGTHITPA